MLGNLRISSKLMIMVCLAVLGIGAVAVVGLSALKTNLLEDRKAKLQDLVLVARQTLDLDREAAKKAGLSDADMLERSKALLRSSSSARAITSMRWPWMGWSRHTPIRKSKARIC